MNGITVAYQSPVYKHLMASSLGILFSPASQGSLTPIGCCLLSSFHLSIKSVEDSGFPRWWEGGGAPTLEFGGKTYHYRPPTKLREGNVFLGVCHSVHRGKGVGRTPGTIPPPPGLYPLNHTPKTIPFQGHTPSSERAGSTHPTGMLSCLARFLPKTTWKWKKLDRGGGACLALPLDPLMQTHGIQGTKIMWIMDL